MLMLAPPTSTGANVVLCGGVTNSFGSKLAGAISHGSSAADLRQCSPVLEWEGLKDVSVCSVRCVMDAKKSASTRHILGVARNMTCGIRVSYTSVDILEYVYVCSFTHTISR